MQVYFSKHGFVFIGKAGMITPMLREYAAYYTTLRDFLRAFLH